MSLALVLRYSSTTIPQFVFRPADFAISIFGLTPLPIITSSQVISLLLSKTILFTESFPLISFAYLPVNIFMPLSSIFFCIISLEALSVIWDNI